jgi:CHAT domain-containing protein/tetratricopeptide (TPR) repeat protein
MHSMLGGADSALAYYARAMQIQHEVGDRRGYGATLDNIGGLHSNLGRTDSALAYYARALPIRREVGDRRGEATTLNNIGLVHSDLSRADSALAYYALALPIRREVGDRAGEAVTLSNIGAVHSDLGRPDSALAYYARALPIQREIGDRAGQAASLHNMGSVHSGLDRPDSALAFFARALPIWREIRDGAGQATTLNNIGLVHSDLGRLDSALAYFSRVLPIQREIGNRNGEAFALISIGGLHSDLGRPDSALVYYALALPILRKVGDRTLEAVTLSNIGFEQYGQLRRPMVAVAYYDSAAKVIGSIAAHAGGDGNRLTFSEQTAFLFDNWTLTSLALAEEVGSAASARVALAAAERGRAQALLELMRRSAIGARGSIGAAAAAGTFGADLSEQGARLAAAVTRTGSSALVYHVTRDTMITWLVAPTGGVSVFRASVSRAQLADQVAVLRHGLGADSATVRDRLALRSAVDLEPSIERGIETRRGTAEYRAAARRLAGWLISPPLLARLPRSGELVIVPSGPLNLVPFAALPTDSTGEPLGVRFSVSYSPSLAALAELLASRANADVRKSPLVVGNPIMPTVQSVSGSAQKLGPLAGAEVEARWVADRLDGRMLRDSTATESTIKRLLPSASVVHLATHGYAFSSESRARDSFIALAPSPGEDGLLTVGEVLDGPSLSAELVVLSACQTGLGDLKQAEGTVGLQRAFLAKGARSVLVSLWSVSDEATATLMKSFYTHWLGGSSKAEALRRAQIELRGKPGSRFHEPRYWAAFQLVGVS